MAAELDPLGDVLRLVQLSGVFYCPAVLTEPWGGSLPPEPNCLWFHVVLAGVCRITAADGSTATIEPGDVALLPHGTGHTMMGSADAATPSVIDLPHDDESEHFGVLRHGGGGATTRLVCGGVRLDHPAARTLLDALPAIIVVRPDESSRRDWLRASLELMAEETRVVKPGGDVIVSRLCDIVVVQAIRAWIDHDPAARSGWIGALRDPRVGAAIAAVHADPAGRWTVSALAEIATMSRSAFAARFTELVGVPPLAYVMRWRMNVARQALLDGSTVAAAARRVGYGSEASFTRAFTKTIGTTPGAVRRGS
ncbi:MAG: AraC family transcriptional regulator [Acidimicrobiaceae bacterium]|nr:AraC family transcriptional regulator [Acidimicrobiaceae bacterium]